MTPEEFLKSISIFNHVSDKYVIQKNASLREFAFAIKENASDVCKWRAGKKNLTIRVIVKLCLIFNLRPHDLNPDAFPPDLIFVLKKKKEKEKKMEKHINKTLREKKNDIRNRDK